MTNLLLNYDDGRNGLIKIDRPLEQPAISALDESNESFAVQIECMVARRTMEKIRGSLN